eukprot:SAG11_NODE_2646_length_3132_cov_4.768216_4_plen_65_part_00
MSVTVAVGIDADDDNVIDDNVIDVVAALVRRPNSIRCGSQLADEGLPMVIALVLLAPRRLHVAR